MKVLLLCHKDHANMGYVLSQCLNKVGVEAVCVSELPHKLYSTGAMVYKNKQEVKTLSESADILIFMHSRYTQTYLEKEYNKTKGVIVFHGGSDYRIYPEKTNEKFRGLGITISLIQTYDLWNLKGHNVDVWFPPAIDTDKLQPVYKKFNEDKKILAHYPSTKRKGTSEFENIVNKLLKDNKFKDIFIYKTGKTLPYEKHILRTSQCDIYFESYVPYANYNDINIPSKKLCGEWGLAALEAASMGKVVIANFSSHRLYEDAFGPHTIQVSNTLNDLENNLKKLILMPYSEFLELQKFTRKWVVDQHSYEVVGKRLVDIFYKHLTWKGK